MRTAAAGCKVGGRGGGGSGGAVHFAVCVAL